MQFARRKHASVAAVLFALALTAQVRADIFLNQPHDFVDRSPSEVGTSTPEAMTADDFNWPGSKTGIRSITVALIVTFPNAPTEFRLEIRQGATPDGPLFKTSADSQVTDLGAWNGNPELHLYSVRFDMAKIFLPPQQRYWVVPYAIGNGSGMDRAWWGTAGNGQVNGSEGYFRSDHFGVPQWTPISQSGILNFPTDFAMTIEASIPAPGVLALLAAGLVGGQRRRRVSSALSAR